MYVVSFKSCFNENATILASRLKIPFVSDLSPKAEDIMIIAGGVIPQQDYEFLYNHGVAAIFGPGTVIPVAADKILDILAKKVG